VTSDAIFIAFPGGISRYYDAVDLRFDSTQATIYDSRY